MKSVVLHLLLLLPHHAQLRETAKLSRRTYACAAVGLLEEEEEEEKKSRMKKRWRRKRRRRMRRRRI